MFDDDLNLASGPGDGVRLSNNVALFLSRKVTAAQREIAHQLRAEVVDHARSETARKEPDKGRMAEKNDDKEERNVLSGGDTDESISQNTPHFNITV